MCNDDDDGKFNRNTLSSIMPFAAIGTSIYGQGHFIAGQYLHFGIVSVMADLL